MKKNKKNILLIVIVTIVLLVIVYFVCTKVLAKNTHKKSRTNTNANSSIIVNQEPADSDLLLKIYEQEDANGNKYVITKNGYNSSEYKYLASYNCTSLNCSGYAVAPTGTKSIIFDNYKYYLYNYGNARLEELDLGSDGISSIEMIYSDKNVYGLYVVNNENKGAFYNLDKKRFITEFVYDANGSNKSKELIDNNYFVGVSNLDDGGTYILYIISNEAGDIIKTIDNVSDIEKELKAVSLT